jgi:hypothetical protein
VATVKRYWKAQSINMIDVDELTWLSENAEHHVNGTFII